MIPGALIVVVAFAYLGLLFAVAYYGDKAAATGRSVISNAYVYSLSLAVYATAWTFYGSVGRAAGSGIGFLPVYLGPTIMMTVGWLVLRKIIRIAKDNHITSLADFVSSRYGKSGLLAGLVTTIAVVGVTPYISLQLKAISASFDVLVNYPHIAVAGSTESLPVWQDTAFYVAIILAAFTVVFGTRHIDAAERHEGMVAAVAFESLVKVVAFLCVGGFVTWGMYNGLPDLFGKAEQLPQAKAAFMIGNDRIDVYHSWASLFSVALISMLAIIFLPRQFQVAVVENVDEAHLGKAIWLFPLYLLLFNIFVLPIALGGMLHFAGTGVNPDTFVLTLPLSQEKPALALLAFIGGFSAATGMVIVESIALSTMVCNDLVMPALLRIKQLKLTERNDLSGLLLGIRRVTIILGMLMGYAYYRFASEAYALVSIGLISFAAVAQFAPAVLGGIYWKGATRPGALAGLAAGFTLWMYTLMIPAFARSGWLSMDLLTQGPFGIELLRPLQLFGLNGLDEITHAMVWSMLANVGAFIGASVMTGQTAIEQTQAALFVDVFKHERGSPEQVWRARGSLPELHAVLSRFLGPSRAKATFADYAKRQGLKWPREADAELVSVSEAQLARVIGAASARIMIASVIEKEPLRDSLTGLPNRSLMLDKLNDAIEHARSSNDYGFAVLFLSLDRFRVITDSLGRQVGDQLLINVSRRLSDGLRLGDSVGHLGGDDFAIVVSNVHDAGEAERFAEQLQGALVSAYTLETYEVFTTASIGIALGKPGYTDPADILRDAETANHRAVARGGACTEVFEANLRERAVALLDMETKLRQAVLKGREFEVHYQPIIALDTGHLSGFEALVRMRRADGTLVLPNEFIRITEETGLIVHIGRWVLREACRQMRAWQMKFPEYPPLQMSVNLAGRQFVQPNLMQQIEQVLDETGLNTDSLKLEVTETVIMEHVEEAAAVLVKLRDKGIKLLMDDFGTGYSSLSYLHRFPVNTLKIDASFIRRMDESRREANIVQTIVTLAHTLNMDIIAEGVETAAHLSHLRELDVEYAQGFYFSPPVDKIAAEALISDWPRW
ncbi:EAL domain-containing protein [Noviherbaspirillum denitrificans]|uniref:EAL domain-containing protein n=1 Tax=Noviherbaspirillum denitrificans TaxID=1968433 RepID=UPI000B533445|nr:EAL domain-containing protein [Noviherbaspirillum denitrificans]